MKEDEVFAIASMVISQIGELSKIEGPIVSVSDSRHGSISVRFEKTAYWISINKQCEVTTDNHFNRPQG